MGAADAGDGASEDPRVPGGSPVAKRALVALFGAGFATFAQLYAPQGVLTELAHEFRSDTGAVSWVIGAATLGVAVGVVPWARLSDRIGRVAAMRWSVLVALAIGLLVPFMPSLPALVAVRFFEGLALAGLPALAVTALAEIVTPVALGSAVGSYVAGTTIGGLAGRVISGLVGDAFGWGWGVAAVALCSVAAAALFLVLIPATRIPPGPPIPLGSAFLANLRNPGVRVLIAQAFLLMGGFVAVYNVLGFRLQEAPFGLSTAQVSWLFLAYVAGAIASRRVWSIVARVQRARGRGDRLGRIESPVRVQLGCIAGMLLGLGLMLLPWLPAVVVGLVLFTGAFFGAHTIASGLIGRRAEAGRSLAPSLYNLGYYIGSALLGGICGIAFSRWGWVGAVSLVASAALAAALLALAHERSGRRSPR